MMNDNKSIKEQDNATLQLHQAPDFSNAIWMRHQKKKQFKWLTMAASVALMSFGTWFITTHVGTNLPADDWANIRFDNSASEQVVLAKNSDLEQQLAQVSENTLSNQQRIVMNNWYDELAMVDFSLEQQTQQRFDEQLWNVRTEILLRMIAFYSQPIDVYEL